MPATPRAAGAPSTTSPAPAARRRIYSHGPALLRALLHLQLSPEGCWEWAGARSSSGYGIVNLGDGRWGHASRVVYEHFVGPIPADMELDHLCRNRCCCRPEHLEAVTHRENVRRGDAMRRLCDHPEHELYRRKETGGIVCCNACRREKRRRR